MTLAITLMADMVFLRHSNGKFTTIDVLPGAITTALSGINIRGEIIGSYIDTRSVGHSFLRSPNGTLTVIAEQGAAYTNANGLNDRGEIVGNTNLSGFLLSSDLITFTTISVPGSGSVARPNGINNRGEIVGIFSYGAGGDQGFLAVPCRSDRPAC